jgi:hypothetical protein
MIKGRVATPGALHDTGTVGSRSVEECDWKLRTASSASLFIVPISYGTIACNDGIMRLLTRFSDLPYFNQISISGSKEYMWRVAIPTRLSTHSPLDARDW